MTEKAKMPKRQKNGSMVTMERLKYYNNTLLKEILFIFVFKFYP